MIKGALFSLENVVYHNKRLDGKALQEIGRLVQFCKSRKVLPVVVANHMRKLDDGKTLEAFMNDQWGVVEWFVADENRGGWKPKGEAIRYVLDKKNWSPEEVVYIGNTDNDMKTARSGRVLFLNATWFTKSNSYGLEFKTPKEIGRFIDLFCLREHLWHFHIKDGALEYYALSPYSTFKPEYRNYSESAVPALKTGDQDTDFWVKYLSSSIYFSGIHHRINYVAPYPGHKSGTDRSVLDNDLIDFTNCFNISYLRDLIIRHKTAPKSQYNRATSTLLRQLNTVHLNRAPLRTNGLNRYKNPPLQKDKTILVVDDICTKGFSLEAARTYIERTGAKVICVSFLKTINTDYHHFHVQDALNPYQENELASDEFACTIHSYRSYIIDREAPQELDSHLRRYDEWEWPSS